MSRRFLPFLWAFTLLFLMMQAPAFAATYVVAPFKVSGSQGYSYLGQAVPVAVAEDGWLEPTDPQIGDVLELSPQDVTLRVSAVSRRDGFWILSCRARR